MSDFFNKITAGVAGGINKGVATAAANSKAMVDKARINTVINNLEAEIKQLTQLLGEKAYELILANEELAADESILSYIARIQKCKQLIVDKQEKLLRVDEELRMVTGSSRQALEDEKICACGNVNPSSAKFCSVCGQPLA